MTKKILLVEDHAINRKLFSDILSFHGYEVIETNDGAIACDLVKTEDIGFIIMDIRLDGAKMNGLDAIKQIKSDKSTSSIPILTLTAFARQEDKAEFLKAGSNEYLSKPFSSKDLVEIVERYLPKPKAN